MEHELPPKRFLNTRDLASKLGVSESTLKRLRAKNTGPIFHRFGSAVRYSVDDVENYINKSREGSD